MKKIWFHLVVGGLIGSLATGCRTEKPIESEVSGTINQVKPSTTLQVKPQFNLILKHDSFGMTHQQIHVHESFQGPLAGSQILLSHANTKEKFRGFSLRVLKPGVLNQTFEVSCTATGLCRILNQTLSDIKPIVRFLDHYFTVIVHEWRNQRNQLEGTQGRTYGLMLRNPFDSEVGTTTLVIAILVVVVAVLIGGAFVCSRIAARRGEPSLPITVEMQPPAPVQQVMSRSGIEMRFNPRTHKVLIEHPGGGFQVGIGPPILQENGASEPSSRHVGIEQIVVYVSRIP